MIHDYVHIKNILLLRLLLIIIIIVIIITKFVAHLYQVHWYVRKNKIKVVITRGLKPNNHKKWETQIQSQHYCEQYRTWISTVRSTVTELRHVKRINISLPSEWSVRTGSWWRASPLTSNSIPQLRSSTADQSMPSTSACISASYVQQQWHVWHCDSRVSNRSAGLISSRFPGVSGRHFHENSVEFEVFERLTCNLNKYETGCFYWYILKYKNCES